MGNKKLKLKKKDDLLIILQNTSNLRTGQDQVVWSIFGAFWGTNALLLISMFSVGEKWSLMTVGIIISIIGILISTIWMFIQTRAINRIKMYEDSIVYIENKLELPLEIKTYSKAPIETLWIKIKARTVMKLCWIISLSSWIFSLIFFIWFFK